MKKINFQSKPRKKRKIKIKKNESKQKPQSPRNKSEKSDYSQDNRRKINLSKENFPKIKDK